MNLPRPVLEEKLLAMVREDLGFYDVTTAFTPDKKVNAQIVSKDSGIASGIDELCVLFSMFDVSCKPQTSDGKKIKKGDVIFRLSGSARDILVAERTALNLLSRMSGIASNASLYVSAARKENRNVSVAATRKTAPLLGFFDKKAARAGGADTHRMGLGDMVLIKNNHLKVFGSVAAAIKKARSETSFSHKIEVEVESQKDAVAAARAGADVVMLDNMSPAQAKKTAALLEKEGLRGKVLVEVSGGIRLANIGEYASCGPDIISVGAITHSARALDFSLRFL